MTSRPLYPFAAIVSQERMKLALLLNAVHPALGGVLIRGEKGSAKSTAVRALTAVLPQIEVVRGCAFNDDPAEPNPCDDCAARRGIGPLIDRVRRRVPMVELPIGATVEGVLGSVDLERTASIGRRALRAGLLARAHRGILYVDEVNLLSDHLTDVLLDAAAMGQNHLERDGISVSHPARFMLVGTMNPEEGELRPQLLDRFALTVEAEPLTDPVARSEVMRRRMAFEADPERFIDAWAPFERELRDRVQHARRLIDDVVMPEPMIDSIARICAAYHVDGLRADLAIFRAAVARAAFEGRTEVAVDDIRETAHLALPHRRRTYASTATQESMQRLDQVVSSVLVG